MSSNNTVRFHVPEAQRLADWVSASHDLHQAAKFCQIALQDDALGDSNTHMHIADALCAAALVRYARAFAGGVRERLPDDVVPQECKSQHVLFKAYRDKWVAHSVSGFEETYVNVVLGPRDGTERGVKSVSVSHHRVVTLAPIQIKQLMALARRVAKNLDVHVSKEKEKVKTIAQTLNAGSLYEQRYLPNKPVSGADPFKARKRWKHQDSKQLPVHLQPKFIPQEK